ncbi:two-component system response regulator [Synergistales bacterium]|nr:two-component system response regulator [Synergistales bacterium]
MNKILVVDDNLVSLKLITSLLDGMYELLPAKSGEMALKMCERVLPDLVLLDIEMPGMDGFETISRLRNNVMFNRIPVIFVTGHHDSEMELKGLRLGARDFITKPVDKNILLHRIGIHLRVASYQTELENSIAKLSAGISITMADMIECRDENTGGHVLRTQAYVERIGKKLRHDGVFSDELSGGILDMIVRATPLHDIGKIAISDAVLLKPGKLTSDEFSIMKKHAKIGSDILKNMRVKMPNQLYLFYAETIAGSHHERFDGKGYPYGLEGNDIPLCGRIMAVADVYDALVDDRVYRKGMSHEEACAIIMEGSGTQFDPRVVSAFEACKDEFEDMSKDMK